MWCCIALFFAIVGSDDTARHPLVLVLVILLVPDFVVIHCVRPFSLHRHGEFGFLSRMGGGATRVAGGQTGTLLLVVVLLVSI